MALQTAEETTPSHSRDIEDKNFQKAELCFSEINKALEPLVQEESKGLHRNLIHLSAACSHQCIKHDQKLCKDCENKWKTRIQELAKWNISWDNTDISYWATDHWSVGKCFVTKGLKANHSPSYRESSEYLSFIINCKWFEKREFGHIQQNAEKVYKDNKDYIQESKISDNKLQEYKGNMITLLESKKLQGTKHAEIAKEKIKNNSVDVYFNNTKVEMPASLKEVSRQRKPTRKRKYTNVDGKLEKHQMHETVTHLSETEKDITSQREILIRYKVQKPLGRGAFGEVFQCYDFDQKKTIAMKTVLHDGTNSVKKVVQQLLNEVKILRDLQNNRIVRYLGCFDKEDKFSIFMELLPNGSVKDYMDNHKAPLIGDVLRRISRQIIEGLSFLHGQAPPILHRDLKASNVLLDANINAKLADFGISKAITELSNAMTSGGGLKGSIRWMAPERINSKVYGTSSDIWSAGCTVIEMATNTCPWFGLEDYQAMWRIGENKKTPLDNLHETQLLETTLERLLQDMFRANPEDRPSADSLLKHDFLTVNV